MPKKDRLHFLSILKHLRLIFFVFSLFIVVTGCPQVKILPQIKMPGELYSQKFKELSEEERATRGELSQRLYALS